MNTDARFLTSVVRSSLKKAVEEGTVFNKADISRALYLRPSSFVYCPLRAFFRLPTALSNGAHEPFEKAYYTSVGTTAHLVWQTCLENSKVRLVKDWLCVNKECRHRHSLVSQPKKCEKCGAKVRGVEHEIRLGWIKGHVDDILEVELPNGELGYIPIDYKSTSLKSLPYKEKNPGDAYTAQLSAYATILSRKLNVLGWCLVFFARDKPTEIRLHASTKFMSVETLKAWSKEHKALMNLTSLEEVKDLVRNRMCHSIKDEKKAGYCDYRRFCFHGSKHCYSHAKEAFSKLESKVTLPLKSLLE